MSGTHKTILIGGSAHGRVIEIDGYSIRIPVMPEMTWEPETDSPMLPDIDTLTYNIDRIAFYSVREIVWVATPNTAKTTEEKNELWDRFVYEMAQDYIERASR